MPEHEHDHEHEHLCCLQRTEHCVDRPLPGDENGEKDGAAEGDVVQGVAEPEHESNHIFFSDVINLNQKKVRIFLLF